MPASSYAFSHLNSQASSNNPRAAPYSLASPASPDGFENESEAAARNLLSPDPNSPSNSYGSASPSSPSNAEKKRLLPNHNDTPQDSPVILSGLGFTGVDDSMSGSLHDSYDMGYSHPSGRAESTSFDTDEKANYSYNDAMLPIVNLNGSEISHQGQGKQRRYLPGQFSNGSKSSTSSHSTSEKYSIPTDMKMWGEYAAGPEPDDELHNPDSIRGLKGDESGSMLTKRGMLNMGTLLILGIGLLMLFGGYPILSHFQRKALTNKGGFSLGGTNASGQVPALSIGRSLIDPDTPNEAKTRISLDGRNKKMNLVFSDEFNHDGRTFYPGDDPFWTAVDLHYWGTGNYEWYDPAAITTANGSLVITMSQTPDHDLNFRSGMLQSWNQFCFTGGYVEVSVILPGASDVSGLWPAAWTMGNLGRAGYGASTDGMWPYTYDSCDVGTLKNQTWPTGGPVAAETTGVYVQQYGPGLSYLPGQRLSRCTCKDSHDHPGPKHPDGTWVGRSAPEIDIFEAQSSTSAGGRGHVSMSAQLAPFNTGYNITNATGAYEFYDNKHGAELNPYTGSVYQQAASGLVYTDSDAYMEGKEKFDSYGFEYKPGSDSDSYILWTVSGDPVWRLNSLGLGPDTQTEIGQRPIPYEPLYIILNLGISSSFTWVNWDKLNFPATMLVDYVRVWQAESEENVGCDPPDYPTADYIKKHSEAYWNSNLTTWTEARERGGYSQPTPGNQLLGQCS